MNYKVLPLMYAASDHFTNTIRFAVEFNDDVDREAMRYAADQVQKRYPYFSVKLARDPEDPESLTLQSNDLPLVISEDGRTICLGSEEANFHLLAFSYRGETLFVDVSHAICDGNGIAPLIKTFVYYYIEKRYGAEGIQTDNINLVGDPVDVGEYEYPLPDAPIPCSVKLDLKPREVDPFLFDDRLFEDGGSYAYNLQVRQKDLMRYAKGNDGSPVSFLSVMMFRALMSLYPETEKDVVILIPHEYRKVLGRPLSHDSLTRVFQVRLGRKQSAMTNETLNTVVRGQVILGNDESEDIESVNGLIQLGAYLSTLPLEVKKQTMQGIIAGALKANTFGISYTGNVSWGGMERYIRDVHAYAGESERHGSISVEVFTYGDYFSICVMQPGKNEFFVDALIEALASCDIPCRKMSEEYFTMPGMELA